MTIEKIRSADGSEIVPKIDYTSGLIAYVE